MEALEKMANLNRQFSPASLDDILEVEKLLNVELPKSTSEPDAKK